LVTETIAPDAPQAEGPPEVIDVSVDLKPTWGQPDSDDTSSSSEPEKARAGPC